MVFASVPAQNALMPMVLIEEGAVVTLSLKPHQGHCVALVAEDRIVAKR